MLPKSNLTRTTYIFNTTIIIMTRRIQFSLCKYGFYLSSHFCKMLYIIDTIYLYIFTYPISLQTFLLHLLNVLEVAAYQTKRKIRQTCALSLSTIINLHFHPNFPVQTRLKSLFQNQKPKHKRQNRSLVGTTPITNDSISFAYSPTLAFQCLNTHTHTYTYGSELWP